MKKSRYIIGIDLGTTNSSLSYIDTEKEDAGIEVFPIPQLCDEAVVKELKSLPSFLYLPGEFELSGDACALPWNRDLSYITGEYGRLQGTRVPSNLVSSAKSWLCHNRVDREGPILPWGRKTSVTKVSPVDASSRYLKHMKDAWNHAIAGEDETRCLENQQIIITIPASFDESARELTAKAAEMAGIETFSMLEEPQAAFYAWISTHEGSWQELTGSDSLILVFDVGGGTTDFTLISVSDRDGKPAFQRVAVGDHIMLGGDNMDLTLAKRIEQRITGPSGKFDFKQWLSATHQCRAAKEDLLGSDTKESASITVLGTGRQVIGGTSKTELSTDAVKETILDGFFSDVGIEEKVQKSTTAGLQELGLPFVSDTSIMRHLSSFLKRHAINEELKQITDETSGKRVVRPDILLFNGGVFRSPVIREHASEIIRKWFSDEQWTLTVFENDQFDQAVSIGAAYYGHVLRGKGERISGGLAKAYYIAVESRDKAESSALQNPITLVCLIPKGVEEGEEIHLTTPEFEVMTNSPVSFTLYASSYRVGDRTGDVITAEKDEFTELPPVKTIMHFGKKAGSVRIPVSLGIKLNEFGTMDVWCESKTTPHRWKLAFQVRMDSDESEEVIEEEKTEALTVDESVVEEASGLIEKAFLSSPRTPSEVTPENILKKIESTLNLGRKSWPLFAVRKMWDALLKVKDRRKATAIHEARWLNLSGFLLRPGFGYQLDEWRMKELWKLYLEGLSFANNGQCRAEWWILWRRVAGGLESSKQEMIFRNISLWLLPSNKKKKKLSAAEVSEMWMLAASLEHLTPKIKTSLGNELVRNPKKWKGKAIEQYFWAISRIGEREPFHGPIERVVPRDIVEQWIETLINAEWTAPKNRAYAIAQMARKTGDRTRDINDDLRKKVIRRLEEFDWSEKMIGQIKEVVKLEWEDEKQIFGESLPAGLYIGNDNSQITNSK